MKEGRRRYGDADGDFMLNGLDSGMRALDGLPSPRFLPSYFPGPPDPQTRTVRRLLGTRSVRGAGSLLKLRWR